MKSTHMLLIIGSSLLVVACAQGDSSNNKYVTSGSGGGGGQIIGGTGGSSGGTGGSSSGSCSASGYKDATCGACMEAKCTAVCQTCMADTNCTAWLQCAVNCSDATCESGCTSQYPAGEAPALAWLGNSGCISTSCSTECGGSSSGGGCGLTTNDATCDACIASYCCTQGQTCAKDQGCIDVLTCIQGCSSTDTTCQDNCMSSNPTGASELNDFAGCMNQSCSTECSG